MKRFLILLFFLAAFFDLRAELSEGFYASGVGGVNFLSADGSRDSDISTKAGFVAGGALGYKFRSPARFEAEVVYRRNAFSAEKGVKKEGTKVFLEANGHLSMLTFMGNLYFDLDFQGLISPYWGFGFGYTSNQGGTVVENTAIVRSADGLAYQFLAGVGYQVFYMTNLALEYRYLAAGLNLRNHSLAFNLRQSF